MGIGRSQTELFGALLQDDTAWKGALKLFGDLNSIIWAGVIDNANFKVQITMDCKHQDVSHPSRVSSLLLGEDVIQKEHENAQVFSLIERWQDNGILVFFASRHCEWNEGRAAMRKGMLKDTRRVVAWPEFCRTRVM
jgi:hypothetical protein